jgi:uncharacterized protein DUF6232
MADFGVYRARVVFQQFTARLRGPRRPPAPPADDPPTTPFKPRGRTYYRDDTTTVIGRTLISPNGTFRIADLASFRPVPQVEPRERVRDAAGLSAFVAGMLIITGIVGYGLYMVMASSFGDATAKAFLGTAIVGVIMLAAYAAVVVARWREVYDRDPARYRHVIIAEHRGESVAITPDLPYESAGQIVAVLDKLKRRLPKHQSHQQRRRSAAA